MVETGGRTIRKVILPGGASAFLNANGEFVEVEQLEEISIAPGSVLESHLLKILLYQADISEQILRELKIMNFHFQSITDEQINEEDIL